MNGPLSVHGGAGGGTGFTTGSDLLSAGAVPPSWTWLQPLGTHLLSAALPLVLS